ncbi:MAG: polyprenyl synthetase family protein [Candidatus Woesearchaeota archaeon]
MDELIKYRDILKEELSSFFDNQKIISRPEDKKIYGFLKEYSLRGKFIRGSLILLLNQLLTGKISDSAIKTAVSMEILHSSILVIDDIIDKDDTRRSKPSMHITVKELIPRSSDLVHDASSIAMCVGLIGTYSAYNLLSKTSKEVISQLSEEFTKTGFAELNEIILAQNVVVSEADVMNIYKFKTAKYTITLPFKLGFIVSNMEFTNMLEKITDNIGILFQVRDDLLELEMAAEVIGKSNTSDIRAGKQHYPRKLLEKLATPPDLDKINAAYKVLDDDSVKLIQDMYKKYDVASKTRLLIDDLKTETSRLIELVDDKLKPLLKKLLAYVVERKF